MRSDLVEFLRLPGCQPFVRCQPGICTTEIFEGFNFINDQAVPATGTRTRHSIDLALVLCCTSLAFELDSNKYVEEEVSTSFRESICSRAMSRRGNRGNAEQISRRACGE